MFYNTGGLAEFTKYTWSHGAIGLPTGYALASYYFLEWINYLLKNNIPGYLVQALFFFLILTISQLSLIHLIRKLLPDIGNTLLGTIVPALFYVCNLFALVSVWNRLQYPFIILYAVLPLALLIYSQALRTRSLLHLLLLNTIFLTISITLSSIPMFLVMWILLGGFTLFEILTNRHDRRYILWCIAAFLFQGTLWIATNLWWILSFITTLRNSVYITSQAYDQAGNMNTFLEISRRFGNMSYLIRMMHVEFFSDMSPIWHGLTDNILYNTITYLTPVLAFLTLLIKRKSTYVYFFLALSLITLFAMKGSEPPFGFIFIFLLNKFRFLEAFRNPFEKIGLLLPLGYAPLIGYSLVMIQRKMKRSPETNAYLQKALIPILVTLLIIIIPFPIWNGWVFSSTFPPQNNLEMGYKVEIPPYYKQANTYLNATTTNSRNIAFPYKGEGITHTWNHGYGGVELYNGIFDTSFISFSTSIQFYKPLAENLEDVFFTYPDKFKNAMQLLNAQNLVIRDDVDYKIREMTPPAQFTEALAQDPRGLTTKKEIGALQIYTLNPHDQLSKIYVAQDIIQYPPTEENILRDVLPFVGYQKGDILVQPDQIPEALQTRIKERLFAAAEREYTEKLTHDTLVPIKNPHLSEENALKELPFIKTLPDNPKYMLTKLRERVDEYFKQGTDQDRQFRALKKAGKRLVELTQSLKQNKKINLEDLANEYQQTLSQVKDSYIYDSPGVQQELMRHSIVITQLFDTYPQTKNLEALSATQQRITNYFTSGISLKAADNIRYKNQDYTLDIPQEGEYELTISERDQGQDDDVYRNTLKNNDTLYTYNTDRSENLKMTLKKGKNKITFDEDLERGLYKQPLKQRVIYARQVQSLPITTPAPLTLTKLTDAHYTATITNVTEPTAIVLSETYHPLWQAKIRNASTPPLPHFRVNSYANAWLLTTPGTTTLDITFTAEESATQGKKISKQAIFITLAALLMCCILRVVKLIRKHRNPNLNASNI
jgi:hypothetical protein